MQQTTNHRAEASGAVCTSVHFILKTSAQNSCRAKGSYRDFCAFEQHSLGEEKREGGEAGLNIH